MSPERPNAPDVSPKAAPSAAPDLLLPARIEPLIAGTIFTGGLQHAEQIGSTNQAAMQAAAAGAPAGSVWLAEEQTEGKGRAGHGWHSEPHTGIYCSALLRPRLSPAEVIILSLAAGLAVVEAVREVTGLNADLRWPNDVLIGNRKFCGILTELNAEVTRVRYVVVGVGINVNQQRFPAELEPIATSLRLAAGRALPRVELTAALLCALHREAAALEAAPAAARESILRRFEQHSSYCLATAVEVEEDGGYAGITRGLDERGFLLVETSAGMRTVLSGGVRKRSQPC
jgi:BirA family biotin operon repressor/biotin-[acetyl-CoA-carboxylase] ligase